MTYRERREARAASLREWAAGREAKAAAHFRAVHDLAERIPLGQPILVGHHSEAHARKDAARIDQGMRAGWEDSKTAQSMNSRAANIETALGRAIYSDDPDACERLRERIAGLEAQRDHIAAYNADCRRAAKTGGHGDPNLLKWDTPTGLFSIVGMVDDCEMARQLRPGWALPGYALRNLSGNIARLRGRLNMLEDLDR